MVFALPGSQDLAAKVLTHLGWSPAACSFKVFVNGEISPKVEQNVSNCDVFVISARNDAESEVNFTLMQLFFFLDALRGESPHRITVILPCLEYARQDRRLVAGEAIPPKLFLRCMKTSGADRFLTMDLHNQAESAFSPAGAVLDELSCDNYLADFVRCNVEGFDPDTSLVCATHGGGLKFTRRMADELRTGFIMADRFRHKAGGVGEVRIIADSSTAEVESVIVVDDMVDTCGSLAGVCAAIRKVAPKAKIYGVATHGYFSAEAHLQLKSLAEKGHLEWIAVTNTISQNAAIERLADVGMVGRLKVVDISRLLAGAIIRIHLGESVNLPQYRRLGPADHDHVLERATLVPQSQYVFSAPSIAPSSNGATDLGDGFVVDVKHVSSTRGPTEAARAQLKRRLSDRE
jgi:ribose-phosphate pyrophosphokinase